jgi:UDPglucose 6-dehydrogenase
MSNDVISKKIGFIGLGKLGLPCALAIEKKGHKVFGYDVNPEVGKILESRVLPYKEVDGQEHLETHNISFLSLSEVVKESEIIFVAVQTPHEPKYEGITRIPNERCDFNYTYLKDSIKAISDVLDELKENRIVVIISTVLPTTVKEQIMPLVSEYMRLCYNPFFIAMGTTIHDFLNPEFVLLGNDNEEAANEVEKFYRTLHNSPVYKTSITNAELIKVSYNTFISMKIVFANTLMEICHKMGGNVDEVTKALGMANQRIISDKYLTGGMGDGGGCHPRDNIAMSFLAEKLNMSFDFFNSIMKAREEQTEWLAEIVRENKGDLPIVVLGKAFKPETNLISGSPSILLKNILNETEQDVEVYDPHIDEEKTFDKPSIFFVGTKHDAFAKMSFPEGSVVVDPWRYIPKTDGVKVIHVGKQN